MQTNSTSSLATIPPDTCCYRLGESPCCLLFVGCLTSLQRASEFQGQIYSEKSMCCSTYTEVAEKASYLTQSQYTDTRPTSPSADTIMPGAWQGSHWSVKFLSHWCDDSKKSPQHNQESNPGSSAPEVDALTTRPTRWYMGSVKRLGQLTHNFLLKNATVPTPVLLWLSSNQLIFNS